MTWTVAYFIFGLRNDTTLNSLHATTSCKNVETLPWKNDLSCCKSLLLTGVWDIILTSLLPPIQSCSSKFWVWSCIASNFDKGWRGDHKHKIMDRPFMPKYGSVSSTFATGCGCMYTMQTTTKILQNLFLILSEDHKWSNFDFLLLRSKRTNAYSLCGHRSNFKPEVKILWQTK